MSMLNLQLLGCKGAWDYSFHAKLAIFPCFNGISTHRIEGFNWIAVQRRCSRVSISDDLARCGCRLWWPIDRALEPYFAWLRVGV